MGQDQYLADRRERTARLIGDVRLARAAGKDVDEDVLVRDHPELMPELGEELAKHRRVAAALSAADADAPTAETGDPPISPDNGAEAQRPSVQAPGYTILRELGRGGQGVVYLATQLSTGRKVALKIMRDGPWADDHGASRFKREVQTLAALNHPNIVTIFDTGKTTDGRRYITMNFIGGWSLGDFMKMRQARDPADPSGLLRVFLKACSAVSAAHARGIMHRDLKPSNIRIDERGEPHILDFGLARSTADRPRRRHRPVSITGDFLGSLPWSSPEQAAGDSAHIDIRTDVYSLGVILYQMITAGRFPYEVVGNIRDVLNNILTAEPTPPGTSGLKTARNPPPLSATGRPS